MSTHQTHPKKETYYFITFTCYNWLPLFEITNIYDYLPFWFEKLEEKRVKLVGYVIMPNHLHLIVYVESENESLNQALAEAKRFLAYEIVKRLKLAKHKNLLQILIDAVQPNERLKGKKHQVFRLSFDAQEMGEGDVGKVLDYMHHNPVKGKWNLVEDYVFYPYSSAGYYENDEISLFKINDFRKR